MCFRSESQNIPVQRLFQSVKHKKAPSVVIKEGWLEHYTDRNPEVHTEPTELRRITVTTAGSDSEMSWLLVPKV